MMAPGQSATLALTFFPLWLLLDWRMLFLLLRNADVAALTGLGLLLNLLPKPAFHCYQALVSVAFYRGVFGRTPMLSLTAPQGALAAAALVAAALAIIAFVPRRRRQGAASQKAGGSGSGTSAPPLLALAVAAGRWMKRELA